MQRTSRRHGRVSIVYATSVEEEKLPGPLSLSPAARRSRTRLKRITRRDEGGSRFSEAEAEGIIRLECYTNISVSVAM